MFKLFLCNPFARSAGIFYEPLSQLSNLLRLQFTVYSVWDLKIQGYTVSGLHSFQGYTVFKFYPLSLRYRDPAASPLNARQYMFENHAIKLINRQLS